MGAEGSEGKTEMKYLIAIAIVVGIYFLRQAWRRDWMPDIKDVQDYLEEMHNKYGKDVQDE